MRALLVLVGLAALVVVGMMSMGLLHVNMTSGQLPSLSFNGGQAPKVQADMATLTVGTENKTVSVPTVGTAEKTVTVPVVKMDKPANSSTAH